MAKKNQYVTFEIDKLTNSIENAFSGDRFDTEVISLERGFKTSKKRKWVAV